ncbi:hypothetical protein N9M68_06620 [Candidatus Poseidonia alphae]|nr:hypothetical protein [Candidatus Poseidonia alphae]MDA8749786.1 hypothetical protein [Candidatus Poseidonia alphae]
MNQDIAIYAGIGATLGLLVGYAWGKISSKRNKNKNINQKLLQNEIERWRIKPQYATLLMGKDPMAAAEKEYQSYKIQKRKNDDKIKEIQDTVDGYLREVVKLQQEFAGLDSKIAKALFMETRFTIWTTRVVEERQRTQNAANQLIAHAYNMEFLDFCRNGELKPNLVRMMDQLDLEGELKNNQKKNWETIGKLTDSMLRDYERDIEGYAEIFGVDI